MPHLEKYLKRVVAIHRSQTSDRRVTLADRGKYQTVLAHWHNVQAGQRVPVRVGDREPVDAMRHPYPSAAEARAAAQAKLNALNRGEGTLSLTLQPGIPTLAAEYKLTLSGFRLGIAGDWIATPVTHELSTSGYTLPALKPRHPQR